MSNEDGERRLVLRRMTDAQCGRTGNDCIIALLDLDNPYCDLKGTDVYRKCLGGIYHSELRPNTWELWLKGTGSSFDVYAWHSNPSASGTEKDLPALTQQLFMWGLLRGYERPRE